MKSWQQAFGQLRYLVVWDSRRSYLRFVWKLELRSECIYDTAGNWRCEMRGDRIYDTVSNCFLLEILTPVFGKSNKMPAHNKRFGEIGGEVIIRISAVSFNRRWQSELCAVDPPTSPSRRDVIGNVAEEQRQRVCYRKKTAFRIVVLTTESWLHQWGLVLWLP